MIKAEINSVTVKKYGMAAGADVVGIAGAGDFGSAPDGYKPLDVLEGCRSVVVLGAAFPREALDMEPLEYTHLRNEMLKTMTDMSKKVAKKNQR